jgi:hypothetical protein
MHEMEGPAGLAAQALVAHAQRRATRPTSEPDTRLKLRCPGTPGVRGDPRVVPVFGGERFLCHRPGTAQGFSGSNSEIFCYPQNVHNSRPVIHRRTGFSPQEIHRRTGHRPPGGSSAGPGGRSGERRLVRPTPIIARRAAAPAVTGCRICAGAAAGEALADLFRGREMAPARNSRRRGAPLPTSRIRQTVRKKQEGTG